MTFRRDTDAKGPVHVDAGGPQALAASLRAYADSLGDHAIGERTLVRQLADMIEGGPRGVRFAVELAKVLRKHGV